MDGSVPSACYEGHCVPRVLPHRLWAWTMTQYFFQLGKKKNNKKKLLSERQTHKSTGTPSVCGEGERRKPRTP